MSRVERPFQKTKPWCDTLIFLSYPSFLADWSCKTGFGWKLFRLKFFMMDPKKMFTTTATTCFYVILRQELYFSLNVIIVLIFGPGFTCYISQWVLLASTWLSALGCGSDFLPDLMCDSFLISLFRKPNHIIYFFILLMFCFHSIHFHVHQQSVYFFAVIPKKTIFWLKIFPWLMKTNSPLLFHMQLCAWSNYCD